ncbi:MAG: response regulator [Candidatus Rokubacteria bacterium]|nr:response regulator [Candidatus Rokubacteria bacterium]
MDKRRILIVDDEAGVTRMLKLFLEATQAYEVRTENQGSRAVAAVREFRPHLVLLDVVMPDMDGAAVAAEIGADARLKDTPVVFLTALVTGKEAGGSGRNIGGRPFIAKPVDPDRIVELIEKHAKN